MLTKLANPFLAEFANRVDASPAAAGFVNLPGCTGEPPMREHAAAGSLLERGAADIVRPPCATRAAASLSQRLQQKKTAT
ncbi:MAG: hypothetical protein ABI389_02180 [Rhodanobacter sp.]